MTVDCILGTYMNTPVIEFIKLSHTHRELKDKNIK